LEEGLATTYEWIRGEMAKQPETYSLDGGVAMATIGASGRGSIGAATPEMSAAD
jgi:hypothetical protein